MEKPSESGIKFSVGGEDEDVSNEDSSKHKEWKIKTFATPTTNNKVNKRRRQSEIVLPFRGSAVDKLFEGEKTSTYYSDDEDDKDDVRPRHVFTLGAKAPLELRRTLGHSGREGKNRQLIHVLGKNSGSDSNLARVRKQKDSSEPPPEHQLTITSPTESPQQHEDSHSSSITSSTASGIGSLPPGTPGQAGQLPRTLSTSVLRIKHKRSFWEKVVG